MPDPPLRTTEVSCGPDATGGSSPDSAARAAPASAGHRYRLLDQIASGGMGVILRAADDTLLVDAMTKKPNRSRFTRRIEERVARGA